MSRGIQNLREKVAEYVRLQRERDLAQETYDREHSRIREPLREAEDALRVCGNQLDHMAAWEYRAYAPFVVDGYYVDFPAGGNPPVVRRITVFAEEPNP